ncbi:hypothetical protein [Rathayibacter sp. VKM Ac-2754]|uniref:hypothetical protein n=1 Tax=Rathayibacter sp. VKM Ac-2754 TaxID=2609251 RepID=UPI00135A628B|nr:hypothetical protein [Rathayibacter sp. VKM Ac-2754]MWV60594.1 hypothetical protein [Rathayibacter sp. VKM Ac-2754]
MIVVNEALQLPDATRLAHALVHHIARENNVRTISIKGPSAEHHRLRSPRTHADADILVEPSGFDAMRAALHDYGWSARLEPLEQGVISPHSVALVNQTWPCDIDLHRHYPGFIADDVLVFDVLWVRREEIILANTPVAIPDRGSSALILALHDLRTPFEERHRASLTSLIELSRNQSELIEEMAVIAEQTGSLATLEPFLRAVGFETPEDKLFHARRDPRYFRWMAMTAQPQRTYLWITRLFEVKGVARLRVLWHAAVSSEDELRAQHPSTPPGRLAIASLRAHRLRSGIASLPSALRSVIRTRAVTRYNERDSRSQTGSPDH